MQIPTGNPDLRYLEVELRRIDIFLQRAVRRWVLAGQDPDDDFRGLYVAHAEAAALLSRPLALSWGQAAELPPEEANAYEIARQEAEQDVAAAARHYAELGVPLRLVQMARDFQLERIDLDILLLCLAPAFDIKYERLYGYLQDNVTHRRPSVRLVLDLLAPPGMDRYVLAPHLTASAALFRHGLLEHVMEAPPAGTHWIYQTLQVDEAIVAWLRGQYQPHKALGPHAVLLERATNATDLLLAGECVQQLKLHDWTGGTGAVPIIVLHGSDQERQDAAARLIAQHFGAPLLVVDMKAATAAGSLLPEVVDAGRRDAKLTGAILHLRHWDICLDENRYAPPDLLGGIYAHTGVTVLSGVGAWRTGGVDRTRSVRACELGAPSHSLRQQLWTHFLQRAGGAGVADAVNAVADQFVLTSDKIRDAVAAACDAAGGEQPSGEELFASARVYSSPRLNTLARQVEPRFSWEDLVLPERQLEILRELLATMQHRRKVLEEWGVGRKLVRSTGVAALFAGQPGTGKTMAAEMLAGELGLDLYAIDLASVVSKYIGETEKNLESVFSEAASSSAILFFDEADALFGKRAEVKDAHDRYANLEISYLLQRMETYDGLAILATNLRANMDEAFMRRLQFVVEFPFPKVQERRGIWRALVPPDLPCAQDLDFDLLAQRYELSGGSIRNIIVNAAYLAASNGNLVTMEHLLHATRRELQKMGRTLSGGDL